MNLTRRNMGYTLQITPFYLRTFRPKILIHSDEAILAAIGGAALWKFNKYGFQICKGTILMLLNYDNHSWYKYVG